MKAKRPRIFQVGAILEGVSPLKDGGMSLRFHTQEVSSYNKTKLLNFYQVFGWLQFSDHEINILPGNAPVRETGAKTPSQRLRGAIMVLHSQKYPDIPAEVFYEQTMEKIIGRVKEELT